MTRIRTILAFAFIFFITHCAEETTAVYWDRAIVEIALVQTGRIDFFVPDEGDSGWWNPGDPPGADTAILDFAVKNLSDKEVSLTEMIWNLFAGDQWVESGHDTYVPPIILPENDSINIQFSVIITENIAHLVDTSDGIVDFTGTGTFRFFINGYDNELYESIRHNYVYNEMMALKRGDP